MEGENCSAGIIEYAVISSGHHRTSNHLQVAKEGQHLVNIVRNLVGEDEESELEDEVDEFDQTSEKLHEVCIGIISNNNRIAVILEFRGHFRQTSSELVIPDLYPSLSKRKLL